MNQKPDIPNLGDEALNKLGWELIWKFNRASFDAGRAKDRAPFDLIKETSSAWLREVEEEMKRRELKREPIQDALFRFSYRFSKEEEYRVFEVWIPYLASFGPKKSTNRESMSNDSVASAAFRKEVGNPNFITSGIVGWRPHVFVGRSGASER